VLPAGRRYIAALDYILHLQLLTGVEVLIILQHMQSALACSWFFLRSGEVMKDLPHATD